MRIHVTRTPTVPLTSYDTKRSSHLKVTLISTIEGSNAIIAETRGLLGTGGDGQR